MLNDPCFERIELTTPEHQHNSDVLTSGVVTNKSPQLNLTNSSNLLINTGMEDWTKGQDPWAGTVISPPADSRPAFKAFEDLSAEFLINKTRQSNSSTQNETMEGSHDIFHKNEDPMDVRDLIRRSGSRTPSSGSASQQLTPTATTIPAPAVVPSIMQQYKKKVTFENSNSEFYETEKVNESSDLESDDEVFSSMYAHNDKNHSMSSKPLMPKKGNKRSAGAGKGSSRENQEQDDDDDVGFRYRKLRPSYRRRCLKIIGILCLNVILAAGVTGIVVSWKYRQAMTPKDGDQLKSKGIISGAPLPSAAASGGSIKSPPMCKLTSQLSWPPQKLDGLSVIRGFKPATIRRTSDDLSLIAYLLAFKSTSNSQSVYCQTSTDSLCSVLEALNSSTGQLIWQTPVNGQVGAANCDQDINQDGITDCIVTGPAGLLFACRGDTGELLWTPDVDWLRGDVFPIARVSDLDRDGVSDLLASAKAQSTTSGDTKRAMLMLVSGKTGAVLRTGQDSAVLDVTLGWNIASTPLIYRTSSDVATIVLRTETMDGTKSEIRQIGVLDLLKRDFSKIPDVPVYEATDLVGSLTIGQPDAREPPYCIAHTRDSQIRAIKLLKSGTIAWNFTSDRRDSTLVGLPPTLGRFWDKNLGVAMQRRAPSAREGKFFADVVFLNAQNGSLQKAVALRDGSFVDHPSMLGLKQDVILSWLEVVECRVAEKADKTCVPTFVRSSARQLQLYAVGAVISDPSNSKTSAVLTLDMTDLLPDGSNRYLADYGGSLVVKTNAADPNSDAEVLLVTERRILADGTAIDACIDDLVDRGFNLADVQVFRDAVDERCVQIGLPEATASAREIVIRRYILSCNRGQ